MTVNKTGENETESVGGGPYRVAAEVSEGTKDTEVVPGISIRIRYKVEDACDWVADKTGEYGYRVLKATPLIGSVVGAVEWLGEQLNRGSSMQYARRGTRQEDRENERRAKGA
jgi:hypothetical protein